MMRFLLVGAGGAIGAMARYGVGILAQRAGLSAWPVGTAAVNVAGALLMGLLIGTLALRGGTEQERLRLLLGVGVLGGFTTFSAYALEIAQLIQRQRLAEALGYALGSLVACVLALFAGLWLARRGFA